MLEEGSSILKRLLPDMGEPVNCKGCGEEYTMLPQSGLCPFCESKRTIKPRHSKADEIAKYIKENQYFCSIREDKLYGLIERWMKAFPNVNIIQSLHEMDLWLFNTGMVYKDYGRFITNWLIKSNKNPDKW